MFLNGSNIHTFFWCRRKHCFHQNLSLVKGQHSWEILWAIFNRVYWKSSFAIYLHLQFMSNHPETLSVFSKDHLDFWDRPEFWDRPSPPFLNFTTEKTELNQVPDFPRNNSIKSILREFPFISFNILILLCNLCIFNLK